MKPSIFLLVLAASAAAGGVGATERTVTLAVDNMTCASCPFIVQRTLAAVAGVRQVDVSFKAKTAAVVYDDAVASPAALTDATTRARYPAKVTP